MAFVLHLIRPDDLFIDVGANVGSYTILACGAKKARGICIEPVPATFGRLCDNLRVNNLMASVQAINAGVSDQEGELRFTADQDAMNHILSESEQSSNAVRVKVVPLDRLLANETPTFLKIDVEGYETPVLRGAAKTLANPSLRSIIIELNGSGSRYGYEESGLLELLTGHGFTSCNYDPFSRTLAPLTGGGIAPGNTLFIRDLPLIRERVAQSPRVLVGQVLL